MPSERIQKQGLITHHNLGDAVYNRFQALSAEAAWVSAVLTPDNCVDEQERVIRGALRQRKPAYQVISEVNGGQPVLGTPVTGSVDAMLIDAQKGAAWRGAKLRRWSGIPISGTPPPRWPCTPNLCGCAPPGAACSASRMGVN
jgi:hypothetical protein